MDQRLSIAGTPKVEKTFECLLYQLSMVLYVPNMVTTGNRESEFDPGKGA